MALPWQWVGGCGAATIVEPDPAKGAKLYADMFGADTVRQALIDAGGNGDERQYSYADLLRVSGSIAVAPQSRGLKRGERVAAEVD